METKKTPKANLENKKVLFREIGLAVALLLIFLSFEWKTHDKTIIAVALPNSVVIEEHVPVTITEPPRPEILKAPIVIDVIEVVDDNTITIDPFALSLEDIKGLSVPTIDYVRKPIIEDPVDEVLPVVAVDEKPKFMGGDENEFTRWVFKNLTYPEEAKRNGIQGRVICSFVVDTNGNITEIKILRGVDPSLDREAIRAISKSPKWTPGKNRGKPVRVSYTFPVVFQLK